MTARTMLSNWRRRPVLWIAYLIAVLLAIVIARGLTTGGAYPEAVVYKTPNCGCCRAWVEHLRAQGFAVRTIDVPELASIRHELRVPNGVAACHTAKAADYVIEGHVPAADIKRLLDTRPLVRGLAVPGMPVGSPGMERGNRREPYDVVTWDAADHTEVFASHR
jgi:hypothetical protein